MRFLAGQETRLARPASCPSSQPRPCASTATASPSVATPPTTSCSTTRTCRASTPRSCGAPTGDASPTTSARATARGSTASWPTARCSTRAREIGVGPYRLVFDGTSFVARDDHGALRLDVERRRLSRSRASRSCSPRRCRSSPGELVCDHRRERRRKDHADQGARRRDATDAPAPSRSTASRSRRASPTSATCRRTRSSIALLTVREALTYAAQPAPARRRRRATRSPRRSTRVLRELVARAAADDP